MAKWAVIYSSVTGNTKKIAEAIAEEAGADLFRVQDAPEDVSGYDVVAVGWWIRRGQPDPLMEAYLPKIHGTKVVFFQTHGTAPESEHAVTAFARAGYMLGDGNEVLGTFGCRGKINPAMKKRRELQDPNDPHGGAKGEERWRLASTHPDEADVAAAKKLVHDMEHKMELKARFLARMAAKKAEAEKAKAEA